jgi:uncharacterized protein (DUF488 family)
MMPRIATVGVYGFTAEEFLATLLENGVTEILDVRQRRGVRGTEYAWANHKRLERALEEAGMGYRHLPELAPTTELRQLQYAADDAAGVGKRNRAELTPAYVERYTREVLDGAPLPELPGKGLGALFCVERDPEACHRSLVAAAVAGNDVLHLRPPAT